MADKDEELRQLWEEAVNKYASGSKRKSAVMEKWKTLVSAGTDIDTLITEREASFAQFRTSDNQSRQKLWSVFKATMDQLKRLGSVAKAGVGLTPFAPATILVEAGLFLIDAGAKVSKDYNMLEELFRRIRNIAERVDEYRQSGSVDTANDHKLHRVVVQLLCGILSVFCEAEAAIQRGSGREMMRRLVGKKDGIQDALDSLDKTAQTEMELIVAKTHTIVRKMHENAEADHKNSLLRQILYTNTVWDNMVFHARTERDRVKQSGMWLLQQPLFEEWKRREFPVLYLLGNPGTGKTYVASRVISELQGQAEKDGGMMTTFFYIHEGMNAENTLDVILKTMAYEVTKKDAVYQEQAIQVCRNKYNLLLPETLWESLFVKPFGDVSSTRTLFIVVDGVDEALPENQEKLLELAKSLVDARRRRASGNSSEAASPSIQLLLVGRPELEEKILNIGSGHQRTHIIRIETSLSEKDMDRFIKHGVKNQIPLLKKLEHDEAKKFSKKIITLLNTNANGMFMLVRLMLDEIKGMDRKRPILEALSKPPRGLDDMFQRVISRLVTQENFNKDELNEMIMWVACAKRDLSLRELDLVLKVRDPQQDSVVGLGNELRTRFGSFFSVSKSMGEEEEEDGGEIEDMSGEDDESEDEDEDKFPPSFTSTTVKFSHASVGQYFHKGEFHKGIGMNVNKARAHIATTCVLFLNGRVPKRNGKPWSQPDLFSYASNYFLDHITQIDLEALNPAVRSKLATEVAIFFSKRPALLEWYKFGLEDPRLLCQLFNEKTCSSLRACIATADDEDDRLYLARLWLRQAKTSTEALLKPFAMAIAQFLFTDNCDTVLAILFLHGYKSASHGKPLVLPPGRSFEHIVQGIPPTDILELAELSQFSKDSKWYINLGIVLTRIKTTRHCLGAMKQFRFASETATDPYDIQDALFLEANTLVTLGQHKKAIEAAESALSSLQAGQWERQRKVLWILWDCYIRMTNYTAALGMSLKLWNLKPASAETIYAIFYAACLAGNYQEILRILRMILEAPAGSPEGPKLLGIALFRSYYVGSYISYACARTGELDLARDAFLAVSNVYGTTSEYTIKSLLSLGQLYYQFYQDDDKACAIWQDVVDRGLPTNDLRAARASFELASIYFSKAFKADKAGDAGETEAWITKLKDLVSCWQPQMAANLNEITAPRRRQWSAVYGRSSNEIPGEELSALLGHWHKLHGKTDLAREAILPLLHLALIDLFDTDDTNDNAAYKTLAQALYCFGDNKKAAIASAMEMPLRLSTKAEAKTRGDKASETETDAPFLDGTEVPFDFPRGCHGLCKHCAEEYQSFTICIICIDVGFCGECYPKLQDGTLPIRICSPDHPHFEIYPPRGLVSRNEDGLQVHLKDGTVSAYDWLTSIKKEWNV